MRKLTPKPDVLTALRRIYPDPLKIVEKMGFPNPYNNEYGPLELSLWILMAVDRIFETGVLTASEIRDVANGWLQVKLNEKSVVRALARAGNRVIVNVIEDEDMVIYSFAIPAELYLRSFEKDSKNAGNRQTASDFKKYLEKIKSPEIVAFVDEAISCFLNGEKRAAVVFSWVGAVAVLYNHVVSKYLTDFNVEASKRYSARNQKWKIAKTEDDLALMQEAEFLEVLQSISVIGKNVKETLAACLKLRNGCGHPNSLVVGDKKVEAHIEDLILNVYSKFV